MIGSNRDSRSVMLLGMGLLFLGVAVVATAAGIGLMWWLSTWESPPQVARVTPDAVSSQFAPALLVPAPTTTATVSPSATAVPTLTPLPFPGIIPIEIRIDSIGLSAPVEEVVTDGRGRIAAPRDFMSVGWWRGGRRPGEPGMALFNGHLDGYSGAAVFSELTEVEIGAPIVIVSSTGFEATFTVDAIESYPFESDIPEHLFSSSGDPEIALITCSGEWSDGGYERRHVVIATLTRYGSQDR